MATQVTYNEQQILQELRGERNAWMQAKEDLITQIRWMQENGHNKQAECLKLARDHAKLMEQHAEKMYNDVYAIINPAG